MTANALILAPRAGGVAQPLRARRADIAAIAIAVMALVVAAYAIAVMPRPQPPPALPSANATVRLADVVAVDYAGVHQVRLGWIHIKNAPAVVELRANYTYFWFLLNGANYGNPATAVLQPGNYTVDAVIAVYANGTKIKIDYRVVG